MDNAERITCNVRKVKLVYVPRYCLEKTDEDIHTDERKRKFSADTTIRKMRGAPKMKVVTDSTGIPDEAKEPSEAADGTVMQGRSL